MFEDEGQTTTTTNEPIDEDKVKTGGQSPETDVDKFIKDVDDLKKNTVSKEEYEKIVAENDKLRKAYIEKILFRKTKYLLNQLKRISKKNMRKRVTIC